MVVGQFGRIGVVAAPLAGKVEDHDQGVVRIQLPDTVDEYVSDRTRILKLVKCRHVQVWNETQQIIVQQGDMFPYTNIVIHVTKR